MNKDAIIEQSLSYKKINFKNCANEKFERRNYIKTLNISDARLKFKIQAKMTPTIQMNFQSSQAIFGHVLGARTWTTP